MATTPRITRDIDGNPIVFRGYRLKCTCGGGELHSVHVPVERYVCAHCGKFYDSLAQLERGERDDTVSMLTPKGAA